MNKKHKYQLRYGRKRAVEKKSDELDELLMSLEIELIGKIQILSIKEWKKVEKYVKDIIKCKMVISNNKKKLRKAQ